ncbi:MAG: hypothetical protein QOJ89_1862, partial [bacterium]
MRLIALLRRRARDERGFTMVTVMSVMFCVTLLSIAALSAAQNDIRPGAHDTARKVAYAAAEAGVQNYLYHLSQDLDYWTKCTTVAAPNAINNPWNGSGNDPRLWASLPGSTARYTIELLPVSGAPACSTAEPIATMIDSDTGTFKIRATGEDRTGGLKRSIVATFRRKSLLDYLYLTDKETWSPDLYSTVAPDTREDGVSPTRDLAGWAAANCDRYWGDDPALGMRGSQEFNGEILFPDGTWHHTSAPGHCQKPGFSSDEVVKGPLHTNDEIFNICPTPQLGNSPDDAIETSSLGQPATSTVDPHDGFHNVCDPDATRVNLPNDPPTKPYGTSLPRSASLQLPLSNTALLGDTDPAYRFKGTTKIKLSGTTMHVKGTRIDGTSVDSDVAIPADGVVYVANGGACDGYKAVNTAGAAPTCGNLELEGEYARNVTFTAENDIVVTGNLQRSSGTFLLGLIATNYVRVAHPVTGCNPTFTCNKLT